MSGPHNVEDFELAQMRAQLRHALFGHQIALEATHQQRRNSYVVGCLVEAIGGHVVVVAGEPGNAKITDRSDLERARAQLAGAAATP